MRVLRSRRSALRGRGRCRRSRLPSRPRTARSSRPPAVPLRPSSAARTSPRTAIPGRRADRRNPPGSRSASARMPVPQVRSSRPSGVRIRQEEVGGACGGARCNAARPAPAPACAKAAIIRPFQAVSIFSSRPGQTRLAAHLEQLASSPRRAAAAASGSSMLQQSGASCSSGLGAVQDVVAFPVALRRHVVDGAEESPPVPCRGRARSPSAVQT